MSDVMTSTESVAGPSVAMIFVFLISTFDGGQIRRMRGNEKVN